jgi:hypothetical protein
VISWWFQASAFKRVNLCARYTSALSLGEERWVYLRPCAVLGGVVVGRYKLKSS